MAADATRPSSPANEALSDSEGASALDQTDRAPAPLDGLRVLDFTHAAAGPFATMFLGDMGAEVIKIESPRRGDGGRYMGDDILGELRTDYFVSMNRTKKSVLVDFSIPEGQELVRAIAGHCDVVVQNFRPGVLDRHRLGYEDLRTVRTSLVYCSISAFGSTGPWRDRPANDIIMQSLSGLMNVTGDPDGGPVRMGTPVCDYTTGLFALVGIVSALRQRDSLPEGQHIEVAMLDASIALMAGSIPRVATLGKPVLRSGRGHPSMVPYHAFPCADGAFLMVGAFTNRFWRRLCDVVNRPLWKDDPRFLTNADRVANRDVLLPLVEAVFLERTRAEWSHLLEQADIPCSPVLEPHDALVSEQAVHNRIVQPIPGADVDVVKLPIECDRWDPVTAVVPPRMGEHTDEILTTLAGLDRNRIDALVEAGVTARARPSGAGEGG